MPKVPDGWPAGALPRMLSREMAAYYVGVSINKFDDEVRAGLWPTGERRGGRILWDRVKLDEQQDHRSRIALQSSVAGPNSPANPWD